MASPAFEKKPPQSFGEIGVRCFCSSIEAEHPTRQCKLFQPRPCTCGHPYSLHIGRCKHKECQCRAYREDQTPEFLARSGIRAGEWGFFTIPQLQAVMRPGNDPTDRVWACCLIHAMNRQGRETKRNQARLATVRYLADPKDERSWAARPLLPDDIVKKLNALDNIARMDKWTVRHEIRENERRGRLRQVGKTRKNIKIFVYLRPLTRRNLPNLVVYPDHQIPANPTNDKDLSVSVMHTIIPIRASFVKTFRGQLRKLSESNPDLVVHPDHEKFIDEAAAEIDLVVQRAYQRMGLVVCSEAIYKEDSTSSKAGGQAERPVEPCSEKPASQPASPPEDAEDSLVTALVNRGFGYIEPKDLAELRTRLAQTPLDLFFRLLDDRLTRGRIGIPILLDKATQARKTHDREKTQTKNGKGTIPTWSSEPELSPPDPDADPVVSSQACGVCGGRIETYRSGVVSQCACALRRQSAGSA